jgi:hypothetical protein
VQLTANARKTPVQRAHSFNVFREMLTELTGKCVDADTRIREEMTMTLRDDYEVPSDDLTEEEMEALYAQKQLRRAENIKKNKKKPKSDEEERLEHEDQKNRVAEVLA